jgi:hypothetical protein
MRLALEALNGIHPGNMTPMAEEYWNKAITTLRTAIEQAEKSNIKQVIHLYDKPPAAPVQELSTRACRSCGGSGERDTGIAESPIAICKPCAGTGQITTPPAAQRQWDYDTLYAAWNAVGADVAGLKWDAFVAKLRSKNGGAA